MKKRLFLFACLCISLHSGAQSYLFKGKTTALLDGKTTALPFALVRVVGTDKGTLTDINGAFSFNLLAGSYHVLITAMGYDSLLQKIIVKEAQQTPTVFLLKTRTNTMNEVVVKSKSNVPTSATLQMEVKEGISVVNKISSKTMREQGASDMQDGVAKIVGIAADNDQSTVYIRGLEDRYNASYLNGMPLPSPNPELRLVALDLFPTSIVSALEVTKVMSSDYYGDFAGGAINIRTKNYFTQPTFNIKIGFGANTQTTLKPYLDYQGGQWDYFGFDDGARQIPKNVVAQSKGNASSVYPNGLYQSEKGTQSGFNNNFTPQWKKAMPNTNFKIEGGNFFSFAKQNKAKTDRGIGFAVLLNHKTNFNTKIGRVKSINAQNKVLYDYEMHAYTQNTASAGLINLHYQMNKNNAIRFNYLLLNTSSDETKETKGTHWDYVDSLFSRRFTYKQNTMQVFQLIGENNWWNKRLKLNWGASYAKTKSQVPDRRQVVFQYDKDSKNRTENYSLFSQDMNQNHRFFSDLNEKEISGSLKTVLSLNYFDAKKKQAKHQLLLNVDYKRKSRSFIYRQFNYNVKALDDVLQENANAYAPGDYFNNENINAGLIYIEEFANPANQYTAQQNVLGTNLGFIFRLGKKVTLSPSLRAENGYQTVQNRNQQQAEKIELNRIMGWSLMPFLNLKYTFNDNNLVRFAASRTLTRPKFSELAPFQYISDVAGVIQEGNPTLQNGINYNLDLKYEFYGKMLNSYTVGVFYKHLQNPIERVNVASASGQLLTFKNLDAANLIGVEFEFSQNLGFLGKKEGKNPWKSFFLRGNISYIYSQINIQDTTGFVTNQKRPLQGASPLMGNIALKWLKFIANKNMRFSTTLSYQIVGKRLSASGAQGIGDQYDKTTHFLNFVFQADLSKRISIGLNIKNILNTKIATLQENKITPEADYIMLNAYKKGVGVGFSFTYRFLK